MNLPTAPTYFGSILRGSRSILITDDGLRPKAGSHWTKTSSAAGDWGRRALRRFRTGELSELKGAWARTWPGASELPTTLCQSHTELLRLGQPCVVLQALAKARKQKQVAGPSVSCRDGLSVLIFLKVQIKLEICSKNFYVFDRVHRGSGDLESGNRRRKNWRRVGAGA